jgi:hypothetical protein
MTAFVHPARSAYARFLEFSARTGPIGKGGSRSREDSDIPGAGRRHGCANSSLRIERGNQAAYEKADFERR